MSTEPAISDAASLPPGLLPPDAGEIARIRAARATWAVQAAASGMFTEAQLAKAAGYATLAGWRKFLHRARLLCGEQLPGRGRRPAKKEDA